MRSIPILRTPRRSALPAFREMRDFDRLFDDLWSGLASFPATGSAPSSSGFSPRVDVHEQSDAVVVTAELPGLTREDFDVSLEDDVLTLRGEKKSEHAEERGGYRHVESVSGSFERRIVLPTACDVDKVEATFKNGVVRVRLPRRPETRPEARTVPITTS